VRDTAAPGDLDPEQALQEGRPPALVEDSRQGFAEWIEAGPSHVADDQAAEAGDPRRGRRRGELLRDVLEVRRGPGAGVQDQAVADRRQTAKRGVLGVRSAQPPEERLQVRDQQRDDQGVESFGVGTGGVQDRPFVDEAMRRQRVTVDGNLRVEGEDLPGTRRHHDRPRGVAQRQLVNGGHRDLDLARVGGEDDQVHDAGASQRVALLVGGRLAQVEQARGDLVDLDALAAPADHPGIGQQLRDGV